MSSQELQYRRTHNLLLVSRILSCREQVSPFTLILDTVEQSGWPLVQEMMTRARAAKLKILFASFETFRKPPQVDEFLKCHASSVEEIQQNIASKLSSDQKSVLVLDTLNPLLSFPSFSITPFLSSLLHPNLSIIAIYHTDIPFLNRFASPYTPDPLVQMKYTATAILTVHSMHHMIARKAAQDKSVAEPLFGMAEGIPGVLIGLGSNDDRGTAVEMEHRRKSGRTVTEWFFVPHREREKVATNTGAPQSAAQARRSKDCVVTLLEDHPDWPKPPVEDVDDGKKSGEEPDTTFNLGLTESQKRDRDAVVLPYFDAQNNAGIGQGGRILYDMGAEDDFDDEEDEI